MSEEANISEQLTPQQEREQLAKEKPRAKDTARLIWASKPKKEPNPAELEFQTAEEVYPNKVEKGTLKLTSFSNPTSEKTSTPTEPNRLIWGDNLLIMQALLAQGYEGKVDLIYIDPPFNTGEDFNFCTRVKLGSSTIERELPISERLAYTDTWSRNTDSFLDMLYPRLQLMKRLLSDKGSIYVHLGPNISHLVKLLMDEIFGVENYRNEIVWQRFTFHADANRFGIVHDNILFYSKTKDAIWTPQIAPLSEDYIKHHFTQKDESGRYYTLADSLAKGDGPPRRFGERFIYPPKGTHFRWGQENVDRLMSEGRIIFTKEGRPRVKRYLDEIEGRVVHSIWTDIFPINSQADERLDYPTQKPEALLERIIKASSKEGSLVADFFVGAGATAAVAEKLGRPWLVADLSKTAIQVTRSRLVTQRAQPFVIQNLGNYQRQLIYAREVKLKEMYDIILKLYGATPRQDWQGFGTARDDNKTLVFVCEPDRPMTGKRALELARLAKTVDGKGYKKLVILAWDYEYNFDQDFERLVKNKKTVIVEPEFKIIPSDVYKYLKSTKASSQGLANKIQFYEKPYLKVSEPTIVSVTKEEARVRIKIERYVVRDIPCKDESKRPEIEKLLNKNFANLIDYMTVDWDYDGEVFKSQWQAIRERRRTEPTSTVAETALKKGKKYKISIRVVDIFGNDASCTKEIDLR